MLSIAAARVRVDVSPMIFAEVVEPGTREHEEIVRFQQQRFAMVSDPTTQSDVTFVETTDYAPERTVPIGVYQRASGGDMPDKLIGAVRIELPGAMIIETMIRLKPGTPAALALARQQVAELGGFATSLDLDKATLVDVIDALVAVIIRIAGRYDIEWFWFFPRKGFISLMRAHVPGLLPPYHLTYSTDWHGWQEESPRYQQFRALRLRGMTDQPQLFQIHRDDFASDLSRRLALRPARVAKASEFGDIFQAAMRRAERDVSDEIVRRHNETHDFGVTLLDDLNVRPGMRVLNADCGTGENLAWLRERVGERGVVVGLEPDAAFFQQVQQALDETKRANVSVFQGSSQQLAFPNSLFDRIYADRTLQRAHDPLGAVSELWRVLAPGGILSLVVPVWETLEVRTGRYRSEDDMGVLESLRAWYRQSYPTQHSATDLLDLMSRSTWQTMRVTETYATFTDLARVRALLQLPEARQALGSRDEALSGQLAAFERRMERAERAVSLTVRVLLLYAWGRRSSPCAPGQEQLAPGGTLDGGAYPPLT